MNGLRDYQTDLYIKARNALMKYRAICVQSATGSGKTPLVSAMVESVHNKKKRAWFIVPRKELLQQASKHFRKWNVPHGIIAPNSTESRAYKIHVVSKDTLIRRYDKIKNWPDLMIFDEGHLYLDRQKEIISHLPESSKIISLTATPERLDGRGLSEIYEELIEGPSIPWLTERGFLSELKYFSPPIDGLKDLHVRGTEYDEEELEALLERKKIYGELVGHYEKHGKIIQPSISLPGQPTIKRSNRMMRNLTFCRSVKQAYNTAERYREKGFNAYCIEGKMTDKRRMELIAGLTRGEIDILTNCELCTYGLDVPCVEYGSSIRPTLSRALYMQIIGRILRPYIQYHMKLENGIYVLDTDRIKYKKEYAMFFDHVNLILEHQDDNYPGMPLHYVPEITWNFHGTEKRKRKKKELNVRLCPYMDFLYCNKPSCVGCPHNPDQKKIDARQPMVIIPADLKEIEKPKSLAERPIAERREIQDRIGAAVRDYKNTENPGAIGELIKIQEMLGYSVLWIYWQLTPEDRLTINYPVLYEICRQKKWKTGKVYYLKKQIMFDKQTKKDYQEVING